MVIEAIVEPSAVSKAEEVYRVGSFGPIHSGVHNGKHVELMFASRELPKAHLKAYRDMMICFREQADNVVRMIGHCNFAKSKLGLVAGAPYILVPRYEHSLHDFLNTTHAKPWPVRQRCALDVAKGMAYLHTGWGLIHGE